MRRTSFIVLLGVMTALGTAACGGPTDPDDPGGNITFQGTITSGGTPLAGVQVFLSRDASKSAVTGANGGFSFTGLSSGQYVVTPSLRDHSFTPSNYELATSRTDLTFTAAPATHGSVVERIAADFTAIDHHGNSVSLYSYFGKVVLIDFSADWCGPCRAEAEKAEALYQQYKAKGFEMLTILISGSTLAWATQYGLTFSVLDDSSEAVFNIYTTGYVPLNIILDRNMTIRYKLSGYYESQITGTIKKYL